MCQVIVFMQHPVGLSPMIISRHYVSWRRLDEELSHLAADFITPRCQVPRNASLVSLTSWSLRDKTIRRSRQHRPGSSSSIQ